MGVRSISTTGVNLGRSDVLVGENHILLGQDLQDNSIGAGFVYKSEKNHRLRFSAAYASASDEPFNNAKNSGLETNFSYSFPFTEYTRWIIALDYSNNRGLYNNKVFPYAGINYSPYEQLQLRVGFPFFWITYETESLINLDFYLAAGSGYLKAEKSISETMSIYAKLGLTSYSFLHVHRKDDQLRLFYQKRSLETGLTTEVTKTTSVGFLFGYAFRRTLFEGPNIFQPQPGKVDLNTDVYGAFTAEFKL